MAAKIAIYNPNYGFKNEVLIKNHNFDLEAIDFYKMLQAFAFLNALHLLTELIFPSTFSNFFNLKTFFGYLSFLLFRLNIFFLVALKTLMEQLFSLTVNWFRFCCL